MAQLAILDGVTASAAFLSFDLRHGGDLDRALSEIVSAYDAATTVWGLGTGVLLRRGGLPEGFRGMPTLEGASVSIPSTPSDFLVRITGADPGEVLHRERSLLARLPSLELIDRVEGFLHRDSRDLTGYIDGTENPTGDKARSVAFGPDGASVMVVQRWTHDLAAFGAMASAKQNGIFGRDRETNEELAHAPTTAHVKRTAQEDFDPEAFIVRRSLPWRDHRGAGLVFVSFSATLDPFESLLERMVGLDDGLVDGLFEFTRPSTGATYWCPPVRAGALDLD